MQPQGFQLKASSLTFTSLLLLSTDLDLVHAQLMVWSEKTPNFFNATPVLLDLTAVETQNLPVDLAALITLLRRYELNPIGVKSYHVENQAAAKKQNLARIAQTEIPAASDPVTTTTTVITAKIIDQPVRSGQQIYAKGCDLILTAPISHGAEVIADGNIHSYSSLHGRALAGAQGNTAAKIFCRKLEAELIAIAGCYLVNEHIPAAYRNDASLLEIFLENHTLHFKSL